MTQFGPAQQILNQLGLKDRPSAGSFGISDAIASFNPITGNGVTELANFLVDAGIYYRTNRFFVTVFPPQIPNNTLSDLADRNGFRFVCESANLPNQTLFTTDFKLNNLPVLRLPYSIDYGNELNLTFRMSQGFRERKFFLNWQEYIFDINNGVEYYNNYTNSSLIVLTQIDTTNSKIYNTQFIGAYPTNVGSIDYSWEADGNYVKQQVSFSYYRMLSEGVVYTQPKQSTSLTQTALNPDILNSNTKTIAMTPGAIT
jgi:hypothetical protein